MANAKTSNGYYEKVVVDSAPSTGGYFSQPVGQRKRGGDISKLCVAVRGTGTWTPMLQFTMQGDADWTDSTEVLKIGDVKEINTNVAGLLWRVGVKQGGFSSGSAIISLNW